jgi:hypothetical protein
MSATLAQKDPDVIATYSIDWEDELVAEADRDQVFSVSDIARPNLATGFYLQCTTAGRTGDHYPTWPRADGETVWDGSVLWTTRHPNSVSVPSVSSATWSVPTGIVQDSISNVGFVSSITLSGGTDGVDYELTCRMTPSSGPVVEQSIIVPVRHQ